MGDQEVCIPHGATLFVVKREGKRYVVLWCDNSRVKNKAADPSLDAVVNLSESQKRTPPSQHASFLLWCAKYSAAHIFRGVFMFVHCSTFVMYCNPAMHFSEYAEHAVGHISDLEDTSCTRAARDGIGRLGTVERRLRRFLCQNRPHQHSELWTTEEQQV